MDWNEPVPSSPDSRESSDPETEDCFGSAESSVANTSSSDSPLPTTRNDSAATQWPFHRDASPRLPSKRFPTLASIHPAFRADPFSISYERDSSESRHSATHGLCTKAVPQLGSPINLPIRSKRHSPPVSPKCTERTLQPKKKLSTIFRFGNDNTSDFEPSTNQNQPAPTEQESRSKLDQIRESFTGLNITDRLRSLARTKRAQQDTTTDDTTMENPTSPSPPKAPRINLDYYKLQPPNRIREATTRLRKALNQQDPFHPPPQPRVYKTNINRAEILRHRRQIERQGSSRVVVSASVDDEITSNQYIWPENEAKDEEWSPLQRNEEALAVLEWRRSGPVSPVPKELEARVARRTPGSPFDREELAFMRRCIRHAEVGEDSFMG